MKLLKSLSALICIWIHLAKKENEYQRLINLLNRHGITTSMSVMCFGSLGTVPTNVRRNLERLGLSGEEAKETMKWCSVSNMICGSIHSFIFIYSGTVAPSVHENCFSGGRGTNVTSLRFDSSLKGGKRWCLFNIKFKAIPKLRSTKRYSSLPIVSFS